MVASGADEVDAAEELASLGAKAEARREDILEASQGVVMLSGKSGVSRTKMSEGWRRPRVKALVRSSFLRVAPWPVALPDMVRGVLVECFFEVESLVWRRVWGCWRGEGGYTGTQTEDLDMVPD